MSESKNAFVAALAKAQSEMDNAVFNKVNPHFRSSYADLGAVREATIKALTSNGFAIMQAMEIRDGGLVLKTELAHESGESRLSYWPVVGATPQQQGSSITYGRRYAWSGLCGIASEEDDDANEAEKETPKAKSKANTRQTYEALVEIMRGASTQGELTAFIKANMDKYDALTDDWQTHINEEGQRLRKLLPNE